MADSSVGCACDPHRLESSSFGVWSPSLTPVSMETGPPHCRRRRQTCGGDTIGGAGGGGGGGGGAQNAQRTTICIYVYIYIYVCVCVMHGVEHEIDSAEGCCTLRIY